MVPSRLRPLALASAAALAAGLLTPLAATAADPRTATLAGDLQSELGCAKDWDEACTATQLTQSGTTYSKTFTVPAGSYEWKVAINGAWDESYGEGGRDGGNIALNLPNAAKLTFTYDDVTHQLGITPVGLAGATTAADATLAKDSLRNPLTKERFYFVMADRFANGDKANDTGGLSGGRLETGFDPTDKGFYHGGDLKGVQDRLDYIKGMGTTAIWLTPSFKNRPVQGTEGAESAGYHGYWITDFTQIDPHLGSNADMKALIDAAHAKGMKVFFDIITNHTADVIDYTEGQYTYRNKASYPYKDAAGKAFDDRDYLGKTFPEMDAATSFPYTPVFKSEADRTVKVPAWLNDPLMYHNRGDSTWAGESSTYGDFVGLDDLFTERPEVVKGMGEIYKTWVDFGIDGFRIDTVKHVNMEFWQQFIPEILGQAKAVGNADFFAFGEVYDSSPQFLSTYTTEGKLQATLDFGFQARGVDYAKGGKASSLADFYAQDDWYTDADSNAYQLPTFLGNHDMGRAAMFIRDGGATGETLMARTKLANSLMYLTRGQPVTYYGDEQGFMGTGGDKESRQDMFATKVADFATQPVLGDTAGAKDRYNTAHPLYAHLAALSKARAKHPALGDGLQQVRYAADGDGLFVTSRYDKGAKVEYLVAANNSTATQKTTLESWTGKAMFTPVFGTDHAVKSGADRKVTVDVPPMSVSVWRANKPIVTPAAAPLVTLKTPADGGVLNGRTEIGADVSGNNPAQATFLYRPVGATSWTTLGTDDNAPYRVYHDVSKLPLGTPLEYRVVVKDSAGHISADGSWGITGKATGPAVENGDRPATQPGAVSVPGSHNDEMGCAADWVPACEQAQLGLDAKDGIWKKSYDIKPGSYAYKAALDKDWAVNYGVGGSNGANISYDTADGKVSFYYDPTTHWVTSDEEGPIITAPGDFQGALGCDNWAPACMRPWLQDKDGDGSYTWSTTKIPAGTYSFKIAHGLGWDENYGAGGVRDGGNITLSVPSDGATTTFVYDSATHVTKVTSG
ncbi:MAG: hypothetical protein LWW86_09575 [Micrococcales bacterium]|nr:hypothetical protein [Micrococcales bacterium]